MFATSGCSAVKQKKNRQDAALFGVTDDGYETLSLNLAHIRKYITKLRSTLQHYRDYYEPETK